MSGYWAERPTRYRPWLIRDWSGLVEAERRAVFVMLNPSTADDQVDDPTIRRCIGFAKREGCDGLIVVNLYALRSTKPAHLWEHPDPVGRNLRHESSFTDNDDAISAALWGANDAPVIVAWGANAGLDRVAQFAALAAEMSIDPWCLGITQAGAPRHPLYVRADQPLIPWEVS